MKKLITTLIALVLLGSLALLPTTASADTPELVTDVPAPPCDSPALVDEVDIGNPASESGHYVYGWGPIEPATHGGGWGGIAPGDCRVAWEPPDGNASASFKLKVPKCHESAYLELRVLDGQGDDSFRVFINDELYYVYTGQGGSEDWVTHQINVVEIRGRMKVEIEATAPQWSGWGTYGQLAVDWAKLYACNVLDYVNIGNEYSEHWHHPFSGWGDIEPTTHGGGWGGIGDTGGTCRTVWEAGSDDLCRSADVGMWVDRGCPPAKTLKMRVLDGLGDDSYAVFVNGELVAWFVAPHPGKSASEEWFIDEIDLTTKFPNGLRPCNDITISIVSTAPAWSSFGTYGQLAVDWIALFP